MPYSRGYARRRPQWRRARGRFRSRRARRLDEQLIAAIVVLILAVWLFTSL
jgi:hypothetical protein